jgi:hypothetical protein
MRHLITDIQMSGVAISEQNPMYECQHMFEHQLNKMFEHRQNRLFCSNSLHASTGTCTCTSTGACYKYKYEQVQVRTSPVQEHYNNTVPVSCIYCTSSSRVERLQIRARLK